MAKVVPEPGPDEEKIAFKEAEDDKEKKPTPAKKASMLKMFSLADTSELLILLLGVLAAGANGALQPIMILLWGDMIDELGSPGSGNATLVTQADIDKQMDGMMDEMGKMALEMCYYGVAALVLGAFQGACFPKFAESMHLKMLHKYYFIVMHSDIAWFDEQDPAALPLQISTDSSAFGESFGPKFGTAVMGIATFIGGYIAAFLRGWPIALVMTGCLPFMMIGAALMGQAMMDVQMENQGWYSKAAAIVEETFYAIRTVVAFGGEPREISKYSTAVNKARWGGVKNNLRIGMGMGFTMGLCFLSYALAFYVGMRFSYDGTENPSTGKPWKPGEILGVFMCVLMASFMLGTIDPGVKAFQQAQVTVARFFDARDTAPLIQRRTEDTRKQIESIQKFELREVHFSYPGRADVKVLNGLSFTVMAGQKVAFVGESGSGKSTVMALLERFYDANQGQVLVNDQDIKEFSVTSLRARIGYVGQEPVLFATSIRQNILQGANGAAADQLEKVCVDAQLGYINDLPDKLDTYVGSGGLQLSGGQKQRIAIARALIKQASVLFLDEATSALDNVSEKMIQETIDNLTSKARSMTIITIAHRLSTVRAADLIYVLSKGVLAEKGNHAELMAKEGLYYALVASQEGAVQDVDAPSPSGSGTQGKFTPKSSKSATKQLDRQESQAKAGAMVKNQLTNPDLVKEEEERAQKIAKEYKVPMSRLFKFNKPEWPYFIPAMLSALTDGGTQPISGILIVEAMYGFQKPKEDMKKQLEMVSMWFAVTAAASFLANVIGNTCWGLLGESLTMRMRTSLYSVIFEQEMGFHDDPDNSPGILAGALQIYTFRVSNLCKSIGNKAAAMSSLVVGLTLSFIASWQMSLVLLGSIPINIGAQALQMIVLLGGGANENARVKEAQQLVSESVQNIRTVHACGVEKSLTTLYKEKVMMAQMGGCRHAMAGLAFGVSGGIMFFIMGGAFYIMGLLIKSGDNDFREVMIAFMGIFFAAMGAGQAASMIGDATKATVACHDAFALLDRKSAINGLRDLGRTPEGDPKAIKAGNIEFKDVRFHYPFRPDVKVLKGVTFSVHAGQSVGVVGPSGGGKSTVMCLLQRYYDPMEGTILVGAEGFKLSDLNIRWWRRMVGFVGQEPILFNTTVRENVMYGLEDGNTISDERLEECRQMSNIDFLNKEGGKGWETEVGPRGSHLSGGQKQRVAICRALVRDPPILLLDEATSALDSQSEKVVQVALEAARKGRTSFAIAHRLSTIADCDTIMVVAEGVILEKGTHAELLAKNGVYFKLHNQGAK